MSTVIVKEGQPRVAFVLPIGLAALLSAGCATVAHSGARFHAMSESEHLQAACELERRAKALDKRFDPSAKKIILPGRSLNEPRGMQGSSSPRKPEYLNPTYRYLVRARDLRLAAGRHRAAAGWQAADDDRVCAAGDPGFRSYGGSLFWW